MFSQLLYQLDLNLNSTFHHSEIISQNRVALLIALISPWVTSRQVAYLSLRELHWLQGWLCQPDITLLSPARTWAAALRGSQSVAENTGFPSKVGTCCCVNFCRV